MKQFSEEELKEVYEISHHLFVMMVEKGGRTDITSIGPGEKIETKKYLFGLFKTEKATGELAIVFGVKEKKPKKKIAAQYLIPAFIGDYKTDVQEVGTLKLLTLNSRIRPVRSGYSWANPCITAGSPGTQVRYMDKLYVDTNFHVALYNCGKIGDTILQPGPYDGGKPEDAVGHVRISLENPLLGAGVWTDYALVEMDIEKFDPILSQSGAVPGPFKFAVSGDKLFWEGRSSGFMRGNVSTQHQDVQVGDPTGKTWYFYDTDYFYPAPIGGDSGSAIWADPGLPLNGQVVNCIGKLFAGSETMGVMIPARSIQKIYPGIQVDSTPQSGGNGGALPKVEYVRLMVQREGQPEISFGDNPEPDAAGIYTWADRTVAMPKRVVIAPMQIYDGAHTCHADVKLEGIDELIKGEVRHFTAVTGSGNGDNGGNGDEPTYTAKSTVISPAEGDIVDPSKPVYFKVKVEVVQV